MKNGSRERFWMERRLDITALIFLIIGVSCFMLFSKQIDGVPAKDVQIERETVKINKREIAKSDDRLANQEKESVVEVPAEFVEEIQEELQQEVQQEKQEQIEQVTIPITNRSPDDLYPDDKETVATISIPDIGLYQPVTYGDSQSNIDQYEVTIRTGYRFNQAGAIILAGHNFKSFGKLFNVTIGNKIFIHAYYGDYVYIVDDVQSGTTDGWNIYNDQGQGIIDYYSSVNRLHLYTCDNSIENGRLIVSAHLDK